MYGSGGIDILAFVFHAPILWCFLCYYCCPSTWFGLCDSHTKYMQASTPEKNLTYQSADPSINSTHSSLIYEKNNLLKPILPSTCTPMKDCFSTHLCISVHFYLSVCMHVRGSPLWGEQG
jgi:hypothetical protein